MSLSMVGQLFLTKRCGMGRSVRGNSSSCEKNTDSFSRTATTPTTKSVAIRGFLATVLSPQHPMCGFYVTTASAGTLDAVRESSQFISLISVLLSACLIIIRYPSHGSSTQNQDAAVC